MGSHGCRRHHSQKNIGEKTLEAWVQLDNMHRVVEGAAGRSYGIHVARLAGVPGTVTERATRILEALENQNVNEEGQSTVPKREPKRQRQQQLRLFDFPEDPLLDEIRQLNVDEMTPREAMDELYRLHQEIARRDDE